MTAIAAELEGLVKRAAHPLRPGEGVTAQMRRAWRALGQPDWWRFRAAWYGQAHEGWAVGVVDDLRRRYARWEQEQEEETTRANTTATTALAALRTRLAEADADFFGEQIAAIDAAIGRQGNRAAGVGADAGREEG